jgi:hypothetical protein
MAFNISSKTHIHIINTHSLDTNKPRKHHSFDKTKIKKIIDSDCRLREHKKLIKHKGKWKITSYETIRLLDLMGLFCFNRILSCAFWHSNFVPRCLFLDPIARTTLGNSTNPFIPLLMWGFSGSGDALLLWITIDEMLLVLSLNDGFSLKIAPVDSLLS